MAGRSKKKPLSRRQGLARYLRELEVVDYRLIISIVFLCVFGLIMIYSASAAESGVSLVLKQFGIGAGGFVLMWIVSYVDYHFYEKIAGIIYIGAVLSMFLVKVPGLGVTRNGASRWIDIGPFSFQPSEFAKFAVIIFLATVIYKTPQKMGEFMSLVKIMAIVLPIVAVVAYNNLSTAIIILGIAVCMLFVASPKYSHFVLMAAAVGVVGVVFISFEAYRMDRIKIWLNPEAYEKGYQTLQGLYAIGSGGLFGKGLGESMQKLGFIPEAQNDMIFSVICEELGLFGAVCVILLFLLMIWRFMIIANNASDLYGALVVVGIMAHLSIQVILNIAVVTNTIPNTGISLPFISYGGTSVLFLLAEMGLALSVAKGIKFEVN